ncbi:hypothetical protein EVAR_37430_1 [Eumeta japonica]|uniref:Uncharacterized protein n=1 Tax=Eumeta variegata TaxID=151549 RepID=A0A4C1WE55_EUMVA|nr:hypothetical protein EVAR_37430_1 [Eumeta japonica]
MTVIADVVTASGTDDLTKVKSHRSRADPMPAGGLSTTAGTPALTASATDGLNCLRGNLQRKFFTDVFYRRRRRDKLPSVVDVVFVDVDLKTRDRHVAKQTRGQRVRGQKETFS